MLTDLVLIENPSFRAWWFLARTYQSMAVHLTHFFDGTGITGAQFGVLRCVLDAGEHGLMLSDLSKRLMVTCGNITGVVDRLEAAGYLVRERDASDRRVVRARLTSEGDTLIRNLLPEHRRVVGDLAASLTPEEQELIGDLCERWHGDLELRRRAEMRGFVLPEREESR